MSRRRTRRPRRVVFDASSSVGYQARRSTRHPLDRHRRFGGMLAALRPNAAVLIDVVVGDYRDGWVPPCGYALVVLPFSEMLDPHGRGFGPWARLAKGQGLLSNRRNPTNFGQGRYASSSCVYL